MANAEQIDLFGAAPENPHRKPAPAYEKAVFDNINHLTFEPREGHPEYMAAQCIVAAIDLDKLTMWQRDHLFPHVTQRVKTLATQDDRDLRLVELGWIIGALEAELIIGRVRCSEISAKYGVATLQW